MAELEVGVDFAAARRAASEVGVRVGRSACGLVLRASDEVRVGDAEKREGEDRSDFEQVDRPPAGERFERGRVDEEYRRGEEDGEPSERAFPATEVDVAEPCHEQREERGEPRPLPRYRLTHTITTRAVADKVAPYLSVECAKRHVIRAERVHGAMRELVFALEYEAGCNRVADALAAHPGARVRSLSLHATDTALWRVDHATGSTAALDGVEDAFRTSDYYADCLVTEDCGATQTTRVLEHTADTLVLYSNWERTPDCTSVPHIARDHLGDGVLFDTTHEGRHYTWRLIHSGGGDVAGFFDDLEAAVGEYADTEVLRTANVHSPTDGGRDTRRVLPAEQEAALRAAVDHGYYESPRDVDVGALAAHLDVPRSTLTYRLRRAEEHLAKRHVEQLADPTALSSPHELEYSNQGLSN